MINFEVWNQLLQQYVDPQGRVNYAAWQTESTPVLTEWLHHVSEAYANSNPDTNTQLAFWINVYNALTIAQILQRYPLVSILPTFLGIPNWLAFFQFFNRPIYPLGTDCYSLGTIEHDILRKHLNEPRIHFALVCASIGCPLLRNGAYWSDTIHTQLDEDAHRFINNVEKVHYDAQTGILYCSKIFKWYRTDFLQIAASVPDYINRYLDQKLPGDRSVSLRYLPYNWHLNQDQRVSS
jgi:hypothetical protein